MHDLEKLYALFHTFDQANIDLALQLAVATQNSQALEYWQSLEEVIYEIQDTEWFNYYNKENIYADLKKCHLSFSDSKLVSEIAAFKLILKSLEISDERTLRKKYQPSTFEMELYTLLSELQYLESFVWNAPAIKLHLEYGLPTYSAELKKLVLRSDIGIEIADISGFRQLEDLTLDGQIVGSPIISNPINRLTLNSTKETAFPDWLNQFTQLQTLVLQKCRYQEHWEVLAALPNLKKMHVVEQTKYIDERFMAGLLMLPQLEELSFFFCRQVTGWELLKEMKNLKELNLMNVVQTANAEQMAMLDDLRAALPGTVINV